MAYGYYRTITIDHTKVGNSETLTDFPVLILSTIDELKTTANGGRVTNSSGYDIIISSSASATDKLDFELKSYNATTGAIEIYVRVPSLSSASDTVLYLLYGDSGVSTYQGNTNGTWKSVYSAVYHLNEATSTTTADSTANGLTATENGTVTQTDAKVGKGHTYSRSRHGIPTNTALQFGTGQCAFFIWAKTSAASASPYKYHMFGNLDNGTNNYSGFSLSKDNSNYASYIFRIGGTSYAATYSGATINDGNWHRYVAVRSGTRIVLYIDGVERAQNTNVAVQSNTDSSQDMGIGSERTGSNAEAWTGDLDEFYVWKGTAPTLGWIITDYNNQNSPSTFYAIGTEQTAGGGDPEPPAATFVPRVIFF